MFHDVPNSSHRIFKIRVVLLPDRSVGNFKKGICHVGVAPVRKSNDSSSEQVTQVLYGESFDALRNLGDWLRIRLHADGYIGWVSSNQVTLFTEKEFDKYRSLPKVIVVEKVLRVLERPDTHSVALREAVVGTELAVVGNHNSFLEVRLPDGLSAYVEKSGVSLSSHKRGCSWKNLHETARSFQGTSYVWGGRSAKGFDCSGLVQTVFRLNGVDLPRDADLQFTAGKFMGKAFNGMRPGDLLFFSSKGDKINHVGIFLGRNREFIHSSGFVRINSLDPRRKNFDKRLFACFVGACRVI
jgi:cell wall-associated NlpC family hydrolase